MIILDPLQDDWWEVETVDGRLQGWVEQRTVKESPELEFLLHGQHEHAHD